MEEETDSLNLWLPTDSKYVRNSKWLRENFPSKTRLSSILILSDNVLEPTVIKETFLLLQQIKRIKVNDSEEAVWEKICARNPVTQKCIEISVLEAFQTPSFEYDSARIGNLSSVQEVIDAIQTAKSLSNGNFDPCRYLGTSQGQKLQENTTCDVANGTKAMLLDVVAEIKDKDDVWANKEFQRLFVEKVNSFNFPEGITAYPFTFRSLGDLIGGNILSDLNTLAAGYVLIFIYVLVNLGKLNSIEQRAWLSVAGIAAVLMGVATSFGLAAHMGVFYSKMNQILPFLMLGVGIDDMFVIMQSVNNVKKDAALKHLSTEEKIALALKHSGVSVTVTTPSLCY